MITWLHCHEVEHGCELTFSRLTFWNELVWDVVLLPEGTVYTCQEKSELAEHILPLFFTSVAPSEDEFFFGSISGEVEVDIVPFLQVTPSVDLVLHWASFECITLHGHENLLWHKKVNSSS